MSSCDIMLRSSCSGFPVVTAWLTLRLSTLWWIMPANTELAFGEWSLGVANLLVRLDFPMLSNPLKLLTGLWFGTNRKETPGAENLCAHGVFPHETTLVVLPGLRIDRYPVTVNSCHIWKYDSD